MKGRNDIIIRTLVISVMIIYLLINYPDFTIFTNAVTGSAALALSIYYGIVPAYYENYIFINMHDGLKIINISSECSGIILLLVFAFVVFIMPHIRLRHRFCALMFLPIIYIANVFRIVSGIIVGDYTNVQMLLLYHSSIGQVLIFLAMILSLISFLKLFGYFPRSIMLRRYHEAN